LSPERLEAHRMLALGCISYPCRILLVCRVSVFKHEEGG
jgi:hypothetical protein